MSDDKTTQDQDDQDQVQNNDEQESATEPLTEVELLQEELAKMKETALRALADLQNYKKKAEEERFSLISMGQVNLMTELLPVLDNFTRAFAHIPEDLSQNEWVSGVSQIEKQLISIIKNIGLEEIPSVGQPANPNLHEIITTAPGVKDVIIQEIEKGYTFKGKVLRASKVIVGA
jgi:molecular chaperone GrpE